MRPFPVGESAESAMPPPVGRSTRSRQQQNTNRNPSPPVRNIVPPNASPMTSPRRPTTPNYSWPPAPPSETARSRQPTIKARLRSSADALVNSIYGAGVPRNPSAVSDDLCASSGAFAQCSESNDCLRQTSSAPEPPAIRSQLSWATDR
jgi:hypothetical protein